MHTRAFSMRVFIAPFRPSNRLPSHAQITLSSQSRNLRDLSGLCFFAELGFVAAFGLFGFPNLLAGDNGLAEIGSSHACL